VNQARDIAPDWMNVRNPLDLGPSQKFNRLLPMLLADSEIDMVLAITVLPYAAIRNLKSAGVTARNLFGNIASVREQHPEKPLVGVVVGHPEFVQDILSICGPFIPIFASPEPAAKALAILWRYSKIRGSREI
jgi:acyl-CoA synthetase (NDP forming)